MFSEVIKQNESSTDGDWMLAADAVEDPTRKLGRRNLRNRVFIELYCIL